MPLDVHLARAVAFRSRYRFQKLSEQLRVTGPPMEGSPASQATLFHQVRGRDTGNEPARSANVLLQASVASIAALRTIMSRLLSIA